MPKIVEHIRYKCKQCNKEGEDKPSANRKFCSKKCFWAWEKENAHLLDLQGFEVYRNSLKGKPSLCKGRIYKLRLANCVTCNKEFRIYPNRLKKTQKPACSHKCATKETARLNELKRIPVKCFVCKTPFRVPPYRLKVTKNITCSRDCYHEKRRNMFYWRTYLQYMSVFPSDLMLLNNAKKDYKETRF